MLPHRVGVGVGDGDGDGDGGTVPGFVVTEGLEEVWASVRRARGAGVSPAFPSKDAGETPSPRAYPTVSGRRKHPYKFAESSELLVRLMPHSTFASPAHRPARGSSPAVIGRVQESGLQPIDMYPFS